VVSHHLHIISNLLFFLPAFFCIFCEKNLGKKEKMKKWRKRNHPGTKLMFPARLPTSLSTSSEFHSQVRDGLAWFH
jgi:hypothetical protein